MFGEERIDPGHSATRDLLRIVGPAVLALGFVMTAIGLVSFFSAFGTFEPPRYFWCAFLGIPLVGVGGMLTKIAYLGRIFRYFAAETAPVGRDTFNTMADETGEGVRTVARNLAQGFQEGATVKPGVYCTGCGAPNPSGANFCNKCGAAMAD